jgi:NAD dependent epimerase/dehydratase family enzyme
VRPRLGVVLGPGGGFIEKTLPLFRRGLGAGLGSGRQYVPWIHLDDVTALLATACTDERYRGPVDVVAGSVPMAALVRALAKAVRRPLLLKVPAVALRLAMGDAAEVVLGSQRLEGKRLRALGFAPRFPDLAGALADAVRRAP